MGGINESRYECSPSECEVFLSQFKSSGYFIESEEHGPDDWCLNVLSSQGGEWGILLSGCKGSNNRILVTISWASKRAGRDPFISRDMKMAVEKMLLGVGATQVKEPKAELFG